MSDLVVRVSSVRRASHAARIVRVDVQGVPFEYAAGQAALIGPADGSERVPYSIASAPEEAARDGRLEFLIKVDAASRWGIRFDRLARGQRLALRGPVGSFGFPDNRGERRLLFIAGGTGIAPLRSMIRHARMSGRGERISLLYSARTPRDFAYLRDLRGMAQRGEITLSLTATRECTRNWRGARGRIAAAQLGRLVDDPATLCFVCGPAAMVADVPPMLEALGIEKGRIRLEDW